MIRALGSDGAMARIIELEDRGIGYAHAVDALIWGDALPSELLPGTWEVDLFIADPVARGRGLGSQALTLLKEEVFSTTLAVAVAVYAPVENERATRAYEKAGFQWRQIWRDPAAGPSWFMVAERPPA